MKDVIAPGAGGAMELLIAAPEDRLPLEFVPLVCARLLNGLNRVAAAVLLIDGPFHEVGSSEYGYAIAGREAGAKDCRTALSCVCGCAGR
ncbi:hypothetical protein AB0B21_22040 [Streptomyces rimosus]|uniref:hypothetical protein n=1 Tax=Streptomyces rimosus TaxID=1927 RepID=UPI00131D39F5|nr:hypothetical protein [Streptomyces rimosus]